MTFDLKSVPGVSGVSGMSSGCPTRGGTGAATALNPRLPSWNHRSLAAPTKGRPRRETSTAPRDRLLDSPSFTGTKLVCCCDLVVLRLVNGRSSIRRHWQQQEQEKANAKHRALSRRKYTVTRDYTTRHPLCAARDSQSVARENALTHGLCLRSFASRKRKAHTRRCELR